MVQTLMRPPALDITAQDEEDIFDLLQASGGMAANDVAGSLRMDEIEVAIYLANQTGLGNMRYAGGEYSLRKER